MVLVQQAHRLTLLYAAFQIFSQPFPPLMSKSDSVAAPAYARVRHTVRVLFLSNIASLLTLQMQKRRQKKFYDKSLLNETLVNRSVPPPRSKIDLVCLWTNVFLSILIER